jgi:RNA polymerase sigma factor (TIGR02999 family)
MHNTNAPAAASPKVLATPLSTGFGFFCFISFLSGRSFFCCSFSFPTVQAEQTGRSGHECHNFFLDAEITNLLKAWGAGDEDALQQLSGHVYAELRRMAHRQMQNERSGGPLQTTALVHELYLRLMEVSRVDWQQRAQFFGMAAQMMRRILVDAARARGAQKRGARALHINFDETAVLSAKPDRAILALDDALAAFAQIAPRQARVVELRYFGGLNEEEIVEVLKVSPRTVRRDWDFARVWLSREILS